MISRGEKGGKGARPIGEERKAKAVVRGLTGPDHYRGV